MKKLNSEFNGDDHNDNLKGLNTHQRTSYTRAVSAFERLKDLFPSLRNLSKKSYTFGTILKLEEYLEAVHMLENPSFCSNIEFKSLVDKYRYATNSKYNNLFFLQGELSLSLLQDKYGRHLRNSPENAISGEIPDSSVVFSEAIAIIKDKQIAQQRFIPNVDVTDLICTAA